MDCFNKKIMCGSNFFAVEGWLCGNIIVFLHIVLAWITVSFRAWTDFEGRNK